VTLEDLALDCVAELFRRDDDGRYVQFENYFDSATMASKDEAGLQIALRRIVFSAVNEGLFRRYRELDPSLGRMIRTIKRHVNNGGPLELDRDQSMPVLALRGIRREGRKLPWMPQDLLEIRLHHSITGDVSVEGVLEVVADVLKDDNEYAPSIPVTEVALAMRSVLTRLHASDDEGEADNSPEENYESKDLSSVVHSHVTDCTSEVMEDMEDLYVNERGVPPSLYRAYFNTARDVLVMKYVDPAAPKESLRVTLCRHIGEISSAAYRKQHQAILEYVVKLTHRQLLTRVAPLV
ncbi:MAG: hypothetical protein R3284_12155, partial [Rubricoccaceae bacterium]|nr:hypothetical protein [Rubricoccaceae bacterium]